MQMQNAACRHALTCVQNVAMLDWSSDAEATVLQVVAGTDPVRSLPSSSEDSRPTNFTLTPTPLPPSSIRAIVTPRELYAEVSTIANVDDGGRNVTFVYALRDQQGRSKISTASLTIVPVTLEGQGSRVQLAPGLACATESLDAASGIGECSVQLPPGLFPSAAASPVQVQLAVEARVCLC